MKTNRRISLDVGRGLGAAVVLQVNANFEAVANAVDDNDARLASVESTRCASRIFIPLRLPAGR